MSAPISVDIHLTSTPRSKGSPIAPPEVGSYRELRRSAPRWCRPHARIATYAVGTASSQTTGDLAELPLAAPFSTADTVGAIDVIDLIDEDEKALRDRVPQRRRRSSGGYRPVPRSPSTN